MNNNRFILIVFLFCLFFNCTCINQGYENDLLQQISSFIDKQRFKVLVSPAFLKAQILTILRRVIPKALARSAAKNTPVLGIFTGIGFAVWRLVKGQPYRAIGQVTSGVLGAPYAKDSYLKLGKFDSVDEFNAFRLKKISYEIEILKQLKLSGSPKCQKMIKTSNSVYVVYEQFPGVSLRQLIKAQQLLLQEKLKIMINLSKTLLNYHNFGINFLLLAPQNIFRSENQNIFFGEWGSAIYKNNCAQVFPIIITKKSQFIANQVLQEGRCSPASDIYSLGKIFSYLADKSKKYSNGQSDIFELKKLSEHMTQKADSKRSSLIEVIEQLQKILKGIPNKYDLNHSKGPIKSKLQTKPSEISFNTLESQVQPQKNQATASITNLKQKFTLQTKQVKTSRLTHAYSFDSILIGMSRTINRPSVSRVKKSCESVAKKMNKARNLSYFIIELSDFAMKWPQGEVLAYLLLKQSYLILNSCYNEWNNEDFEDKNVKTLTQILKQEILQLNLRLNMLKQYLSSPKCDPQFKIKLRNDLQINQKFYKQQIFTFCHRLIGDFNKSIKENKVKNLTELVDNLSAVYMILKHEQQGSYEKFWDKIYTNQYAFLKNQSYFENEKKLGYRYLRSKIAQVLNKK